MIIITDYGMGNLGSIENMLKKIGQRDVKISGDPLEIERASGIILPGVGAYDTGVTALKEKKLDDVIRRCVLEYKKPILGICLGMQLLGNSSEEGVLSGLGLIDFECKRFKFLENELKIPHMGWDYAHISKNSEITENLLEESRFYFVHSYYAVCKNEEDILMTCNYGGNFVAAVSRGHIYGVQFHPEKSHQYGTKILKNFSEVCNNVV